MSDLSFRLAKAAAAGRSRGGRPTSREQVLAKLLVKRAMAHQAGLDELEAKLRGQIAWALPVRRLEIDACGEDDGEDSNVEDDLDDRL
jgi:hypothetical protein